jgi:hypothetical protein
MKTVKENTTKKKSINKFFEKPAVKRVSAVVLMKDGKFVGKVLFHYSDNPAGSVCTAYVYFDGKQGVGTAGGYGYDKASQAIYFALKEMYEYECDTETYNVYDCTDDIKVEPGRGNEREAFEEAGYDFISIL